jgi:hypothetical protein
VAIYAIIFLAYYSWSFSISHGVVFRQGTTVERSIPTLTMLLMKVPDPTELERDAAIMRSVTRATTTEELDDSLRQVLQSSLNKSQKECPTEKVEYIRLNDAAIEETLNMFPTFRMEVLAAALRRLAILTAKEIRKATVDGVSPLLSSLLETIAQQMVVAQREHGLLGVYALADVLQALSILAYADIYVDAEGDENLLLDRLTDTAVEMLSRHEVAELKKLGPIRLLQCLQAMAKLGIVESPLHFRIYEQLLKPNASSRLPARYLAHGLDALASLVNNRVNAGDGIGEQDNDRVLETNLLARSFMRRMRKQNVRDEATIDDLCRALLATNDLWHSGGLQELEDEAAMFGFTTLRAILKKKHESHACLAPSQMATMMSAWATLTTKQKEDTVIEDLMAICESDDILARASILELERIVSSIEELRITSHADIMRIGGERLVGLTLEGKISPKAFNAVLRCPVLLHRRNQLVMEPYIRACENAFANESFLQKCSIGEIANFLWFASIVQWRHEASLQALARRIMDPELCDKCTPKLASRILATYTSIVSLPATACTGSSQNNLSALTSALFHNYGGHLLSNQLSAAEVSSSLYAYAKASYFQDMGIFDHLLSLMACMATSQIAPTARQMTQSLWSCGKMSVFDSQDESAGSISNFLPSESPSVTSSRTIALALSRRAEEMSPVDVAQCIWALGRLGTADDNTMSCFAGRAMYLASDFNAVEISNILWGLSKTRYGAGALVDRLARRLCDGSVEVTPKEAAMALYALGRMRVAEEEVFESLSMIMIEHIDETSAQGIANTLWAYRNVSLRPPPQLLNLWALQKLGLVTFDMKNQ